MIDIENGWQKYINKNYHFSLRTPPGWVQMIKESVASGTVVLYNADKNLIRIVISNNEANKQFIGGLITNPFKTVILTDSGLHGKLSIGASKNNKKRIIAWFYTEKGGLTYHMIADMDSSFAIQNKDVLISVVKSLDLDRNA